MKRQTLPHSLSLNLVLAGVVLLLIGCIAGVTLVSLLGSFAIPIPFQRARMVMPNLFPTSRGIPRFWIPVSGVGEGIEEQVGSIAHTGADDYALDYVWERFEGIDVYPTLPGQVVYSGYERDYGWTVVVRHYDDWRWDKKYYSIYAHLQDKDLPSLWVDVDGNHPIGHMGKSGNGSNGIIHLHFAVRSSDRVYDGLTALYGKEGDTIVTPAFYVRPYLW